MPDTVESRLARVEERLAALTGVETRLARVEERLVSVGGDLRYLASKVDKLCDGRDANRQDIIRLQESQSHTTRVLVALQLLGSGIASWLGVRQ